MEKKFLILIILGGILLISLFSFFIAIRFSGNVVSELKYNETDFVIETEDKDNDKDKDKLPENCWRLEDGRIVCKIASNIKIESGEVSEEDFKIKKFKD